MVLGQWFWLIRGCHYLAVFSLGLYVALVSDVFHGLIALGRFRCGFVLLFCQDFRTYFVVLLP